MSCTVLFGLKLSYVYCCIPDIVKLFRCTLTQVLCYHAFFKASISSLLFRSFKDGALSLVSFSFQLHFVVSSTFSIIRWSLSANQEYFCVWLNSRVIFFDDETEHIKFKSKSYQRVTFCPAITVAFAKLVFPRSNNLEQPEDWKRLFRAFLSVKLCFLVWISESLPADGWPKQSK